MFPSLTRGDDFGLCCLCAMFGIDDSTTYCADGCRDDMVMTPEDRKESTEIVAAEPAGSECAKKGFLQCFPSLLTQSMFLLMLYCNTILCPCGFVQCSGNRRRINTVCVSVGTWRSLCAIDRHIHRMGTTHSNA